MPTLEELMAKDQKLKKEQLEASARRKARQALHDQGLASDGRSYAEHAAPVLGPTVYEKLSIKEAFSDEPFGWRMGNVIKLGSRIRVEAHRGHPRMKCDVMTLVQFDESLVKNQSALALTIRAACEATWARTLEEEARQ